MKKIASILLTLALVCVTVLGTGTTAKAKGYSVKNINVDPVETVAPGSFVKLKFTITDASADLKSWHYANTSLVILDKDEFCTDRVPMTMFGFEGTSEIYIQIPQDAPDGTLTYSYCATKRNDNDEYVQASEFFHFTIDVKSANRKPDLDPKLDPKEEKESEYYVNPLRDMLTAAVDGGWTDTIQWNEGTGLPNDIMKKLYENPTLSLNFKFTYKDVEHEVYIAPGQAVCDDTAWYGPEWLLEKYGEKGAGGEYTVVKDDNLNALAAKFNTTVEELLKKNPFITDKNLIYPGQVIKY